MIDALALVHPQIAELCRRFHVRRLDIFGSAARSTDFTEKSDFDFIVEYEAGMMPSVYGHLEWQEELAKLLGRKVDLVMEGAARNPYVLAGIERSRQTVHGP